jgi:hypothetical protein
LLIEKMPLSEKYSLELRKKHYFCGRCFYEEESGSPTLA